MKKQSPKKQTSTSTPKKEEKVSGAEMPPSDLAELLDFVKRVNKDPLKKAVLDKTVQIMADAKPLSEFGEAVRKIKRDLPHQLEFSRIMAQITREKYNALITEGFTKEEALELCKSPK